MVALQFAKSLNEVDKVEDDDQSETTPLSDDAIERKLIEKLKEVFRWFVEDDDSNVNMFAEKLVGFFEHHRKLHCREPSIA